MRASPRNEECVSGFCLGLLCAWDACLAHIGARSATSIKKVGPQALSLCGWTEMFDRVHRFFEIEPRQRRLAMATFYIYFFVSYAVLFSFFGARSLVPTFINVSIQVLFLLKVLDYPRYLRKRTKYSKYDINTVFLKMYRGQEFEKEKIKTPNLFPGIEFAYDSSRMALVFPIIVTIFCENIFRLFFGVAVHGVMGRAITEMIGP
jgi:hypothetical protein